MRMGRDIELDGKRKIQGQYGSGLTNMDVDDPKSLTELIAVAPRSLGIVCYTL